MLRANDRAHAAMADADGQYPFELLPSGASDDAATLLVTACIAASGEGVLWRLLDAALPGKKPSAEAVRAAVEADPGAAARPFATPAGWKPVEGALVRLRPGLGEKEGLRAGELATVTRVGSDGDIELERNGEELDGWFKPADLAHGFDGWLPLHAAAYLALDKEALSLLLEAHTAAAATADAGGQYPLHLAASAGADKETLLLLLEAHTGAAATAH